MGKCKIIISLLIAMFVGVVSYAQNGSEYPSYSSTDLKIENKIQIYPNPSVDFLKVTIEKSNLINPQIIIHTIIGNKLQMVSEKTASNEFKIDVKNLPAGYYLLAVKDASTGFSETYKFLKR